jgi:hypothetical protein
MAKSTTFKGQPKPLGKSGHYYETRRHELQGRGIKTGNLANQTPIPKEPVLDLGMMPDQTYKTLQEENKEPEFEYSFTADDTLTPVQPEEAGAEEVEIEDDEVEIKKPTKGFLKEMFAGFNAERDVKSQKLRVKAKEELGEEADLDEFETPEFESGGEKFGKILADLFADYRSEDFNQLSDSQLEELAVKFDSTSGGLFGKPNNPFLDELKQRIKSKEHIKFEKAKLDAELEPSRLRIKQEIADIRKRTEKQSKGESDFLERLFGI